MTTDCVSTPCIEVRDVSDVIDLLRVNTAAGDRIPPFVIKGIAGIVAPALVVLYNRSLKEGVFPNIWKRALISPIPKKGDRYNVSNYRLVSVINVIAKEKCVHIYLINSLVN